MLLYLNCMASRITGVHNFIANSSLNTHSSSVARCGSDRGVGRSRYYVPIWVLMCQKM